MKSSPSNPKTFLSLPQETQTPYLSSPTRSHPSESQIGTNLLSESTHVQKFHAVRVSHDTRLITLGFLQLACVFRVYPGHVLILCFIPFYCQVIFHYVDMPHLLYPLIGWQRFWWHSRLQLCTSWAMLGWTFVHFSWGILSRIISALSASGVPGCFPKQL